MAKATVQKLQQEKQEAKKRAADRAAEAELRRHFYAAWLASACKQWVSSDNRAKKLQDLTKSMMHERPWAKQRILLPDFWEHAARNVSDVKADPPRVLGASKPKAEQITWASEAMSAFLYSGRTPAGATTPTDGQLRFQKMVESVLPGYGNLLNARFPSPMLLKKARAACG